MSKNKNIIAIIYIFLMMFLSAMCDNVRGPFVPIIKKEFSIDNKGDCYNFNDMFYWIYDLYFCWRNIV